MKKALLIGLAPIVFITNAFAANIIRLNVSQLDLTHYRDKPEKYEFVGAQFQLNNNPNLQLEEMETRGQGSISYKRRNFGLKLTEKIQVGRIDSKKINLLSMSADPGYVSTRLGLMAAELLQIGQAQPTQVQQIEAVANSIYQDVATKHGQELFTSLKQKMDIDAYMRWMVMNSLFTNGDFPDEIFFYVDADMYAQGKIFFRVMPWDFDDLFKGMHSVLTNQTEAAKPENLNSILYSYEDRLDRSFSPANVYMYEQLKATARLVLNNHLTPAATDNLLYKIRTELTEYAGNAGIIAMTGQDSGRKGIPYSASEIGGLFSKRKKQIDDRRAWLMERIK